MRSEMRTLSLFLIALPLFGQAPVKLTLQEAEAMAVRNNPDVSEALLQAAAANQVTLEVRSAFLPTVYGSVTGVGALSNSAISAGSLTNSTVYSRLATGFTAGQLISDFGRTSNLTASARLHAEGRADADPLCERRATSAAARRHACPIGGPRGNQRIAGPSRDFQ